mgnify:CR=1 FL=1
MLKYLTPNAYYESLAAIKPEKLVQSGIKGVIFDLDNTITTWNNIEVEKATIDWFVALHNAGIKACILSNNSMPRIKPVAGLLGIYCVEKAKKPLLTGYRRAMQTMGTNTQNTLMVGDQLFTDIWGAKRLGLKGILVKPISLEHEFMGTRFNRFWERRIMKAVQKRIPKEL